MSMQDPIADMLARIKNAQMRAFLEVKIPASKIKMEILRVFKEEGFIEDWQYNVAERELVVTLRYYQGKPVIEELIRVSRVGLRKYSSYSEIKPYRNGLGISVVSTSKGVMSDVRARKEKVGGEIICKVV